MSAATMPVTDLSDTVMFENPFPRYAELRRMAPVSQVKQQFTQRTAYMLTRYADVQMLHADRRFSSDPSTQQEKTPFLMRHLPRMFRLLTDSMVFKDDPEHARLRGLVQRAFTPKLIKQMEDQIDSVVADLLDDLERSGDTVDLVEDYAVQLPLRVIADMLGVDEADRDEFHGSTKKFIASTTTGPIALLKAIPDGRRMMKLFERIAERRRREPDDRIVSTLVQANDEGDRLGDDELLAMIFLLLLAGHDTTQNLIGTGTVALIEHPDQLARLRENPGLADSAVEELLRFCTPVPCGAVRFVLDDIDVAGTTIPAGSGVLGMIISANRDESVFDRPDELDLGRTPNKHLAFAFGAHYCLGHQLARLEARAAIGGLFRRFGDVSLAVPRSELRWKPTQSLRGFKELPARLR
jgi:cytochrome P450